MNVAIHTDPEGIVTFRRILIAAEDPTEELFYPRSPNCRTLNNSDRMVHRDRQMAKHQKAKQASDNDLLRKNICDRCGKGFPKAHVLKMHQRTCGKEIDKLVQERKELQTVCRYHCTEQFKTKEALEEHMDAFLDAQEPCLCGKVIQKERYATSLQLRTAFIQHASKCSAITDLPEDIQPPGFQQYCVHCDKTFTSVDGYEGHLDELLKCEQPCPRSCGKVFVPGEKSKLQHRRSFLTHIKSCQKRQTALQQHQPERIECRKCHREFSKYGFSNHADNCTLNTSICQVCGKDFLFPKRLGRHLRRSNCAQEALASGDVVECETCQRRFMSSDQRRKHDCKGPPPVRQIPVTLIPGRTARAMTKKRKKEKEISLREPAMYHDAVETPQEQQKKTLRELGMEADEWMADEDYEELEPKIKIEADEEYMEPKVGSESYFDAGNDLDDPLAFEEG